MDVLYAINSKTEPGLKIKKNQLGAYPQGSWLEDHYLSGSTIIISNLLNSVNKYFPDVLPESVLRHFGYDSRPTGEVNENKKIEASPPLSSTNGVLNRVLNVSNNSISKTIENVNSEISEDANTQYSDRYESEYLCVLDNYLTIDCRLSLRDNDGGIPYP